MPTAGRIRWAKFRVAVVIVAAAAIMAVFVYLLTGGTLFQSKATIYVYVPDATGIDTGSPVRVDGIDIGKVARAGLSGSSDPNRVVQVTMLVERERLPSVPVDSYAELGSDNLVGDKFVDITSGRSRQHVAPDGEVPYRLPLGMLKSLDLRQFEAQLREVDATLLDIEDGRSPVGQFILGEDMYNDLRRRTAEIERGMRAAASTTTAVGQVLYSDKLYRKISQDVQDLDRGLARLQAGQGSGGQLLQYDSQYNQARGQIEGLRRSTADMRAAEFLKSDGMYEEWNRSLTALAQKVDEANTNPLMETTAAYDNLNGLAARTRDTLREFREDPKKFLRLRVF
jgi:phospholipid/cholesterol/gamma-HCH transport system substrate-binding protein